MILELADFSILPGQNAAFEQAIRRGLKTVLGKSHGFQGFKLNHCIETPQRYVLQIFWDTLQDHTVGFRQSPAFTEWRAIVGPFFASPPIVEHFDLLAKSANADNLTHPADADETNVMPYAFAPAPTVSLPVVGSPLRFAVHRIYCVGLNYEDHAREMGFSGREPPFFFMKPADAVLVVNAGETAVMPYPSLTRNLHHEIELVVAIGKGGKDIQVADALQHVFGYGVGLDMTRRDLQSEMKQRGRPWCIGKGFDASAPVGPITEAASAGDIASAELLLQVNGQERQRSNTAKLIWNVAEIIAHLSAAWELQAGDLIFTGTPEGVAAVLPGDILSGAVTGLTSISVRIQ